MQDNSQNNTNKLGDGEDKIIEEIVSPIQPKKGYSRIIDFSLVIVLVVLFSGLILYNKLNPDLQNTTEQQSQSESSLSKTGAESKPQADLPEDVTVGVTETVPVPKISSTSTVEPYNEQVEEAEVSEQSDSESIPSTSSNNTQENSDKNVFNYVNCGKVEVGLTAQETFRVLNEQASHCVVTLSSGQPIFEVLSIQNLNNSQNASLLALNSFTKDSTNVKAVTTPDNLQGYLIEQEQYTAMSVLKDNYTYYLIDYSKGAQDRNISLN